MWNGLGLLIALGALSVFSFFFHAGSFTTPLPQRSFAGLVVLFALFVAFQLHAAADRVAALAFTGPRGDS